jgi:hypothetical protein
MLDSHNEQAPSFRSYGTGRMTTCNKMVLTKATDEGLEGWWSAAGRNARWLRDEMVRKRDWNNSDGAALNLD